MEEVQPMSDYFSPKLQAVEALALYQLRTSWSTGEVLDVNVGSVLKKQVVLAHVLDAAMFSTVHIGEGGGSIEWVDEELGADNVYAWAKEQAGEVSHEMFDAWILRNKLSLATAAVALGISRRMVSYYRTAHNPIPRAIWLACLGWEVIQPTDRALPRSLPTAREYAALHA